MRSGRGHPKQPVAAALASRAAVRPALRQGGAFALGLAGGWAVLYGALLPFGLGLTLGLPADCFAACAAGAALSILFHGFGAFSLDSLCLLCAVGAAVAARWLWPGRLRPAFLAGCGALVLGGACFALGPGGAGFTLVFFCGADALLAGSFGGVNLEDISAPRCFEIERRLKECCDIPIFHDDQHGTAVVTLAAMLNALKLTGKKIEEIRVVTSGAGAAGIAIIRLLIAMGLKDVVLCDRQGAIYQGREGLNKEKEEMAAITNQEHRKGTLAEVLKGADVFIGVSAPGMVTKEMVQTMNEKAIIFACANPTPEIFPDEAKAGGAVVVSTGRSDYPNQINNVLAFPGIFRGALDVRASDINDEMKVAAAYAIANIITDEERNAEYIIPNPFDKRVAKAVAEAVAKAARDTGVARI